MPSTAGDRDYYLIDGEKYPRVTSVIQQTMAKPALMKWAYSRTRDSVSGLVAQWIEMHPGDNEVDYADFVNEMLACLTDADWLEEVLKENRLRPEDISDEASDIGTERHALFESLGSLAVSHFEDADRLSAIRYRTSDDGHERAIADWWLTRDPMVVASEVQLVSRIHRYAGTCDLVWYNGDVLTLTDLKNRKADDPCGVAHRTEEAADRCHVRHSYESDHVQVGAYEIAWNEENEAYPIMRRTVLVAKADGSWIEDEVTLDSSTFLDYLSAWKKMREVKR